MLGIIRSGIIHHSEALGSEVSLLTSRDAIWPKWIGAAASEATATNPEENLGNKRQDTVKYNPYARV